MHSFNTKTNVWNVSCFVAQEGHCPEFNDEEAGPILIEFIKQCTFDYVLRQKVWQSMGNLETSLRLIRVVKSVCT